MALDFEVHLKDKGLDVSVMVASDGDFYNYKYHVSILIYYTTNILLELIYIGQWNLRHVITPNTDRITINRDIINTSNRKVV